MESLVRGWDGETVIVCYDRPTGAWILIAIHSTRLGPATGGTRMKHYPNIVAGGANNLLAEPSDAARLKVRGILYAPDKEKNACPEK